MAFGSIVIYVSPLGNDKWLGLTKEPASGGNDGPLASLAGARDAVRRLRQQSTNRSRPVTIVIAGGIYELPDTFTLGPQDEGVADAPVRYVAAEGAAPVISGGRRISGWNEIQHKGKRAWVVDLPEVAEGSWNFNRLYVGGTPRVRPRLPHTGFYHFTGTAGQPNTGENWGHGPDAANFAPGDIQPWHNWRDVEIHTYQLWIDTHLRIKSIDESTHTVHFHSKCIASLHDERQEFARYFVENVFEALEHPGQWYLDRPAGKLYYLPLEHETPASTTVVAPRLTELLRLSGDPKQLVHHLRFENLTFAHQHFELAKDNPGYVQAAFGVPGAILLGGASDCVFYGCTVEHVSGYGIEVLTGSTRNTIAACAVRDAGAGGVKVAHEALNPHNSTLGETFGGDFVSSHTTVVDSTIHDFGHLFPSAIGIWVGNSGWNRLLYNHIFDGNYTGISCGWTWGYAPTKTIGNRIEFNHIHHINHREVLSDNGGIYTLGQQPGLIMRGNVIHDISCYGYGASGIYPDEGSSEMRVEQNLVYNTKKAGYATHYGRDNLVQHNIFALSSVEHVTLGHRYETHRTTVLRKNIIAPQNGQIASHWGPTHYTSSDNLVWSIDGSTLTFGGLSLLQLQAIGQAAGTVVADPLFTDPPGEDFSLRQDSPAFALGFKAWDWKSVGPRLRAQRPVDYETYLGAYPLPSPHVPVLRTRIELLSDIKHVAETGVAEFQVTVTNVGLASGADLLTLSAGPAGVAELPNGSTIEVVLAPQTCLQQNVTVRVLNHDTEFWLESESTADVAIPARKVVWVSAKSEWRVPPVNQITHVLEKVTPRMIRHAGRLVAEVRLASTPSDLLVVARLFEPNLRPNLVQPWAGTGFEFISTNTPSNATEAMASTRHQVFLVPEADKNIAHVLRLDPATSNVQRATDLSATAKAIAGGVEITATLPWKEFGQSTTPTLLPFELITDAINPTTDQVVQVPAFELPWDGPKRLEGKLKVAPAT
jgi:hypothetical protein